MKINQHALKYIFNETLFRQENTTIQKIETDLEYLGGNNKEILIITPAHKEILIEEEKKFLIKILNSIGLQLEDVVIVNQKKEAPYSFYSNPFNPKKLILFGVKPFEIGIKEVDIPTYEIKDFQNTPILYVDKLTTIQSDLAKKKALWTNLKQLF